MTLRFTPISEIQDAYQQQRSLSNQREFASPKERIAQLKRLRKSISQHEVELLAALKKDLGKSNYEGFLTEIGVTYKEID
ncbi:MAG: aldehyde dehydrogenase, partial [Bacteroidota bacterium]